MEVILTKLLGIKFILKKFKTTKYFTDHRGVCQICLLSDCPKGKKKTKDDWVECSRCGRWSHINCVGITKDEVENAEYFYCMLCRY